jgi:hypothetical protein
MEIHKGMTNEEYEGCYREALLLLHGKYENVGDPYQKDGQRVCKVETLVIDDHTVFLLAWGPKVTEQIEHYSTC